MTTFKTITFPSGRKLEKISLIKESPIMSFYTAEECVTESEDDFSAPEDTVCPVWLAISKQVDNKTLQLWKDWMNKVTEYYGVVCKEVVNNNAFFAAVLSLENAELMNKFPAVDGNVFVSKLCSMVIRLDSLGFSYSKWSWSNIVQVNDNSWYLMPSLSMERTVKPDPKRALTRLGKWLLGIKEPFLQTQPARSIVELIASGQIPDDFPESVADQYFWSPQEQCNKPVQLELEQDQKSIVLKWDAALYDDALLFKTDGKKKAYPGQFICQEDIDQYGTELSNVAGINPIIDSYSGTAQWSRPQDNSRYQSLTITPAVRRDSWFEWGVPVVVGGPEEAVLLDAYYDNDSEEIVLRPSWSEDKNITKLYIVIRQDRFAQNVNDVQPGGAPLIIERRLVNHPIRKQIRFSFKLYIVIFNAVITKGRVYFSSGLANCCRKVIFNLTK